MAQKVPQQEPKDDSVADRFSAVEPKDLENHRKTRPIIIDRYIKEAREQVIRYDLDLAFLRHTYDHKLPNGEMADTQKFLNEDELVMFHNYFLARLLYFKSLRDKYKAADEVQDIEDGISIIAAETPETITIKKEC